MNTCYQDGGSLSVDRQGKYIDIAYW